MIVLSVPLGGGTEDEEKSLDELRLKAADFLNAVPPGPLGNKLFGAVAKRSISLSFEAAALRRRKDGRLYVYLRKRPDNDSAYPGQYHMPGSVKQPGEKWKDVLERLSEREFGAKIVNRRKVGDAPSDEARGAFVSTLFLVDLKGTTAKGKWHPIDELPAPMVHIHESVLIPLAIVAFEVEEAEKVLARKCRALARLKKKHCDE